MARRQALLLFFLFGLRAVLLVEHFLFVAQLVILPHVAVVVAIVHLGVGEINVGRLVFLAARARDERQGQSGDVLGGTLNPLHLFMEPLSKLQQVLVFIGMIFIQYGVRKHGQAVPDARFNVRVAIVFDGLGMQGQKQVAKPRIGPHG